MSKHTNWIGKAFAVLLELHKLQMSSLCTLQRGANAHTLMHT